MASTLPKRLVRATAAFVLSALTMIGLAVVVASASSASSGALIRASGVPREGKGFAVAGGDFVGYYVTAGGRKLYCLSPKKALPAHISLHRTMHYPGLGKRRSAWLAYALGRWGNASSDNAAAAESQVLNTIVGNRSDVRRRAPQLPKQVAGTVRRHLRLVHRYHGPYRVVVQTPRAALPGQRATGTVTVSSAATRHRLHHVDVRLTGSPNVHVPARVTTNARGVAHFRYQVRDVGEVHVLATATGLPAMSIYRNHPGAGVQHMVSPVHHVKAHGSASFRAVPSGIAHRYACTTTCNGRPVSTVRACSPADSRASRLTLRFGRRTSELKFPARGSRHCAQIQIATRDGDRVTATWQYRTAHGWSAPIRARGSFRVDCPAVPPVGIMLSADCTHGTLRIGLARRGADGAWSPLTNPSRHRMVLAIGGARTLVLAADPGHKAVFRAPVSCSAPRTYTWQAGVQRANGDYNYGPRGSVTTPSS